MNRTAIYGILLVFACSMALFLVGFTIWQFGLLWLAAGFYALAVKAIWLAFALLLLLQIGWSLYVFWQGLARYFRREAIALRHVARLQMSHRHAGQRLALEKRQVHYQSRIKRQRVLLADDKKHSGELFEAINAEFRQSIPADEYKDLRKTLVQYHKQADAAAMLALRKQVLCRFSIAG